MVVEDSALLITTCLLSPPSGTTLECNYLTSFHGGICCTYGNHGSVREYSSTSAACVLALWILMVEFEHKWLREAPPWPVQREGWKRWGFQRHCLLQRSWHFAISLQMVVWLMICGVWRLRNRVRRIADLCQSHGWKLCNGGVKFWQVFMWQICTVLIMLGDCS